MRSLDFFNLPNPSSLTMALGSTQPLTEMSTKNFPGGKERPARKAVPSSVSRLSGKCASLDVSRTYGPPRPVTGTALPLLTNSIVNKLTDKENMSF
jgi:hypothetical protein